MNLGVRTTVSIACIFALSLASGCARTPSVAKSGNGPSPQEERKVVVAKVNGVPINRYVVTNMIRRMEAINQNAPSPESEAEIRRKALDQLIFRELAYQEAKKKGMTVEDQRVDFEMERFITSMGHEEGYNEYLNREQLTAADVRSDVERALLLQSIATVEVVQKVTVTDDEVRAEYERREKEFTTPERITISEIFVPASADNTSSRKAEELRKTIAAGKDKNFGTLVSDGTFTVRSRQLEQGNETELYEAARKLGEGRLSDVIKTNEGLHIIRVDGIAPEKVTGFEDVRKKLKDQMTVAAQLRRFQEWEQELKKDAAIEVLDPRLRKQ